MKLFVVHKMTRNNTLNKVRVAATELPQLLSVAELLHAACRPVCNFNREVQTPSQILCATFRTKDVFAEV